MKYYLCSGAACRSMVNVTCYSQHENKCLLLHDVLAQLDKYTVTYRERTHGTKPSGDAGVILYCVLKKKKTMPRMCLSYFFILLQPAPSPYRFMSKKCPQFPKVVVHSKF